MYELRTWLYSRDQATRPDATVALTSKLWQKWVQIFQYGQFFRGYKNLDKKARKGFRPPSARDVGNWIFSKSF